MRGKHQSKTLLKKTRVEKAENPLLMGLKRIAKHFKVVHSKHRLEFPDVLHQHIHEFVTHTHQISISWTFLRNWPNMLSVWSIEGVIRLIYMDLYGDACTMRVLYATYANLTYI